MLGSRSRRFARSVGATLVVLSVLLAACGGGDEKADNDKTDKPERRKQEDSTATTTAPAPSTGTFVAAAVGPEVQVYPAPDAPEPIHTLANPYENGTPLVFLVDGSDVASPWLPVYLPVKPNGSKGFVRSTDVTVQPNPYRVTIVQSTHALTVTKDTEVVVEAQVGLGRASMESPVGVYFIKELIENIGSPVYGPYAYGLSAFTENPEVAAQFGGDGVVGLHGTNDPSSIGQNVSHGCIRVNNDVITQLAGMLPLGTPVEIQA